MQVFDVSQVTVSNAVFTANTAHEWGGAINANRDNGVMMEGGNCSLRLQNVFITRNQVNITVQAACTWPAGTPA